MKKLVLIGGTMGVGKTTVSQLLKEELDNSFFLDGDWCWDMNPFVVNEQTKAMVMSNIIHILNNAIHCSIYDNIIFCWVMHEQSIIDNILSQLDLVDCHVYPYSLICSEEKLKRHLLKDIQNKIRKEEIILKSVERLSLYNQLDTDKIDVSNLNEKEVVNEIKGRILNKP